MTHILTLVVVKFHILTTIIIQIKCLSFYGDTLNLYFHTDCIMILWSCQSTLIVSMIQCVSKLEMKEAWNGSLPLHPPCLYHCGYVHWLYHDILMLWIYIECIMIQSRVKPLILSSKCVLIRKLRSGGNLQSWSCLPPSHQFDYFQHWGWCFMGVNWSLPVWWCPWHLVNTWTTLLSMNW